MVDYTEDKYIQIDKKKYKTNEYFLSGQVVYYTEDNVTSLYLDVTQLRLNNHYVTWSVQSSQSRSRLIFIGAKIHD